MEHTTPVLHTVISEECCEFSFQRCMYIRGDARDIRARLAQGFKRYEVQDSECFSITPSRILLSSADYSPETFAKYLREIILSDE